MKSYRDLLVWQKGMDLVVDVYSLTTKYPKSETYGLMDQTRRAAVSIPANIAEGYGRQSTQDYIRFLHIARGSLYEVQTHLEIANRLQYADTNILEEQTRELERMLSSLILKLKAKLADAA